ncbi:hypothetical protein [Rhodopseudomonas palustris]|uniref:Uncharacterized protein n=1 Tax=Rhodopseudomonas palustris TaxID=1076 RepID=A0A418UZ74_RHOPL|nr:hypothetical protein [Rhodopseudomonas palustris]RJF68631.1 hypothetical protein D4Q52_21710 [Rhodopseudomonas palustris]
MPSILDVREQKQMHDDYKLIGIMMIDALRKINGARNGPGYLEHTRDHAARVGSITDWNGSVRKYRSLTWC